MSRSTLSYRTRIAWIILPFLFSCGPSSDNDPEKLEGSLGERCFGADLSIRTQKPLSRKEKEELRNTIETARSASSLLAPSSSIQRFNRSDRGIGLKTRSDDRLKALIQKAKKLHERTDGAFDPTVAPLIEHWSKEHSNMGALSRRDERFIDSVLAFVGFDKVRLKSDSLLKDDPRVRADLSGLERGFLLEKLAERLNKRGLTPYMIKMGNKYRTKGYRLNEEEKRFPVQYPLRDWDDKRVAWLKVDRDPAAVATAGDLQKFYTSEGTRYAETIDPKTGLPAQSQVLSVTVIGQDAAFVDGLGTAYMVMGREAAYQHASKEAGIEAFFVLTGKEQDIRLKGTEGIGFSGAFHGLPSAVSRDSDAGKKNEER